MHVDKTTLYLSKPELVAMAAYIGRDTERPNLRAMFVDLARRRVWATDGRRAAILTAKEGDHTSRGIPMGLPPDAVAQVVRAAKARDTISITPGKRRARIVVTGADGGAPRLSIGAKAVAADPPPIEAVIPRYETKAGRPAAWVALNPRYIGALSDLWRVARDDSRPVVLYRGGELDPVLAVFAAADGSQWRVVIMPIRHSVPVRKSA